MNYCSVNWNNSGLLSRTDLMGVQHYYGMGPRYASAAADVAGSLL